MCFFKKLFGRKKVEAQPTKVTQEFIQTPEEPKELPKEEIRLEPQKEDAPIQEAPIPNEVSKETTSPSEELKSENISKGETADVLVRPVVEEKKPKEPNKTIEKNNTGRYSGKFEVYPEAGFFKYRLKASNGEILVVSSGYTTKNGAINGIDTLKKNAEIGQFQVITDKNKFSQFQLFNANGSRTIVTGEFYESVARAESALESFKKFVKSDKIEELEAIDPLEVREEMVPPTVVEQKANGRLEIVRDDKYFRAVLKASNSETLFGTSPYASKASLLSGLEAIKKTVENGNFRVSKDKQGRFQFVLYSANNQLLISGETYKTKEAVLSAIDSVKRFLFQAKLVE